MVGQNLHEQLDDLYREVILDHFRSPRHTAPLTEADVTAEGFNPLCGDEIVLQLKLQGEKIANISIHGRGCSISQASGSILTELLYGKTLTDGTQLITLIKEMMHGTPSQDIEQFGDLEALAGVKKFPVRIKCALLAWTTLEEGLKEHSRKKGPIHTKTEVTTND